MNSSNSLTFTLPPYLPQPANIFLKAGLYKLGDFGLVASVNSSDGLGDCLQEGDSRYMSAELLQDGPKDLTKCDIFSLGATVYEICRGRPLPPNGEEWHVLRSGTLPALEFGGAEAGGELMRVLTQMMAVGRVGGREGGREEGRDSGITVLFQSITRTRTPPSLPPYLHTTTHSATLPNALLPPSFSPIPASARAWNESCSRRR